ncbi:2-hydroxyacid dehydrogenase, partial [Parabacteroides merdae]
MAYKIAFFGAKPYDIASFDKVNEKYNYDIRYYKGHLNPNNVVLTQDTDVVCIFVNDTADAAVIDAMVDNGVKLLALRCAGFNNVDLKAAKGKLPVVRVPAYSPYAVAEYSLALMLSLNRKIHRAYWRTRDGNFSLNGLMGFDMHGKTIGIIGTGKIAKILIRLLKGFGMRILAYDLYPDMKFAGEEGISYVSLDELYRESDIISLHCPLTDQTKYMIDKDSIDKMKEGVMIINTGRGQLINTNDLIEGLKEKKIAAAGLDVYEEEGEYFYEDKSDKIIDDDVLA